MAGLLLGRLVLDRRRVENLIVSLGAPALLAALLIFVDSGVGSDGVEHFAATIRVCLQLRSGRLSLSLRLLLLLIFAALLLRVLVETALGGQLLLIALLGLLGASGVPLGLLDLGRLELLGNSLEQRREVQANGIERLGGSTGGQMLEEGELR